MNRPEPVRTPSTAPQDAGRAASVPRSPTAKATGASPADAPLPPRLIAAPVVELREASFDPWQWVADVDARWPTETLGAAAVFVGRMRDHHAGRVVREMWLEHYPGMTERRLAEVALDVARSAPVRALAVVHRVGRVRPGDALVVVAAWSGHRNAAQDAGRALLERVKFEVPLWKRETLADGRSEWVMRNTDGREPARG